MSKNAKPAPTLAVERTELSQHSLVGGVDEVGRGALAGPVCVGIVVVGPNTEAPPSGLRDSKELSATRRAALVPAITDWAEGFALGWSGPREIDQYGIVSALQRAGLRALAGLRNQPTRVILDGSHDWLTNPQTLFTPLSDPPQTSVLTLVKADQTCASVAAASVLAKVARDRLMVEADSAYPQFGFRTNKGYGTLAHRTALARQGLSPLHRASWALLKDEKTEV